MVLVRRIRKRGANIVVEANAEVLFAPTGDVGRWTNRFSQRVRSFTAEEAPTNKRPRWAHYGKPLKTTMTASTTYQPGRMKVYSAVGSTAPHAYYVDQGTGVYNESGPYKAKILPPWTPGSASLYEATWVPPGHDRRVKPVMIKGQKGQFFFDAGLRRGFQSMRMRSFQVPGDAQISKALSSFPTGLENFAGNTPADAGFMSSLEQWRSWRDAHYNSGGRLGKDAVRIEHEVKPRRPTKAEANMQAYLQTKAAAARRRKEQLERLREMKERREEGLRKRREEERKRREANELHAGNADSARKAREFYTLIRKAHPEATLRHTTLPDGVVLYRVSYVLRGETIRQQWAYGYNTD